MVVIISPVSRWTSIHLRRSPLLVTIARQPSGGTKARLTRARVTSVRNMATAMPVIIATTKPNRTAPMFTNMRTPSTSAVARDIRSPVFCLSWKAKLRCWSLS